MTVFLRLAQKYNLNNLKTKSQNNIIRDLRRRFCENTININTNVAKDVILFKYDQPKFFKFMNIFAGSQFAFWSYLSYIAYTSLRDIPINPSNADDLPWWRKINFGDKKYKTTITVISFLIGYSILCLTWMYTLRSVRYLILRKGGQMVTIVTYSPAGINRMLTLDLNKISCKETRSAAKSQLPIKVKNHYLHYMLDMRGEFRNPALFDHTAGLARKW